MHPEQFAVVRDHGMIAGDYKFGKFHDTLEAAKEEALRLAKKEKAKFIVLKMVGFAEPQTPPATWTDF